MMALPSVRAFSSSARRRLPLCSLRSLRSLEGSAFKFPLDPAADPLQRQQQQQRKRRAALATGLVFLDASGLPRAFINRCPHARLELDLDDSDFFCDGFLQCKAHGAFFDPATGICVRGPVGKDKQLQALEALHVEVDGDEVVLVVSEDGTTEASTAQLPPDIEKYRRGKQRELAEAQAVQADEVARIQQELHEKTRARLEQFRKRDERR